MKLKEAEKEAKKLIYHHLGMDWNFRFDSSVSRCGCCTYSLQLIALSEGYVQCNSWNEVKDTVLHEIAHALTGPGHGHDKVWKERCREIGANPCRVASKTIAMPPKQYVAICKNCGHSYYRCRIPRKKSYSCGKCSKGRYNSDYHLDFEINPDWLKFYDSDWKKFYEK